MSEEIYENLREELQKVSEAKEEVAIEIQAYKDSNLTEDDYREHVLIEDFGIIIGDLPERIVDDYYRILMEYPIGGTLREIHHELKEFEEILEEAYLGEK